MTRLTHHCSQTADYQLCFPALRMHYTSANLVLLYNGVQSVLTYYSCIVKSVEYNYYKAPRILHESSLYFVVKI